MIQSKKISVFVVRILFVTHAMFIFHILFQTPHGIAGCFIHKCDKAVRCWNVQVITGLPIVSHGTAFDGCQLFIASEFPYSHLKIIDYRCTAINKFVKNPKRIRETKLSVTKIEGEKSDVRPSLFPQISYDYQLINGSNLTLVCASSGFPSLVLWTFISQPEGKQTEHFTA